MLKNVRQPLNDATTESDVLEDILDTLRFRGSIFFTPALPLPGGCR
jgi:hypothetical protein